MSQIKIHLLQIGKLIFCIFVVGLTLVFLVNFCGLAEHITASRVGLLVIIAVIGGFFIGRIYQQITNKRA